MEKTIRRSIALSAAAALVITGCGGGSTPAADRPEPTTTNAPTAEGIRLVSPADGAAIQQSPPDDLVILDVRTAEEFAESHLDGAEMIDFYREDFADRLAELDPTKPYLLYCRSGNRSGQTAEMMRELGFEDVADVDGGITTWIAEGLAGITS